MQQSLFDSVDPAPTDPDSVQPEDVQPEDVRTEDVRTEDVQPGDIEPGPTRTADTEAPGATNLDQGSRGNRPGQRKAHEVEHASQEYAHYKPEENWTPDDLAERWGRPDGHLPSRSRAEFILYARFDLHLYWNPDADRLMGAAFENGTLRLSAELDTRRNAALALNELQDFILHYLIGLRPFHEGATGQPVAGRPVTIYH